MARGAGSYYKSLLSSLKNIVKHTGSGCRISPDLEGYLDNLLRAALDLYSTRRDPLLMDSMPLSYPKEISKSHIRSEAPCNEF